MSQTRNALRRTAALLFAVFALSLATFAQEQQQQESFPQIKIKNFGRMDERFFRGAEPKKAADFAALRALGIRTVLDLQSEPELAERGMVEAAGMRYVNIPMVVKKYPTEEAVAAFLKAVDDPDTGKFFVHCAGGRHRTGAMGAVYRFTKYGWDYEQVYREMKQFDFYTSWGHGDFKKFVENYWQRVQSGEIHVSAAPAPHHAAPAPQHQK